MENYFLEDIHILDLSQFLPGPYATQMLADMGAEVLKVEPPSGDPLLEITSFAEPAELNAFYRLVNAGKKVVKLDLKSSCEREIFSKFVQRADVILESFRPGVMRRLGFDYKTIRGCNSRLIYCALTGFGQTGPDRLKAGHDINYVSMTGALSVNGPSEKPLPCFPPIADYGGAMQAANAILGALFHRAKTGNGAFLDIAMADTVLSWQSYGLKKEISCENINKKKIGRERELLNGGSACYNIYKTKDKKFISLGAIEKKFWENFCIALGRKDWVARQADRKPQTNLINEVAKVIAQKPRDEWNSLLSEIDCCYSPVLSYSEVFDWPQVKNRKVVLNSNEKLDMRSAAWFDGKPPSKRFPVKIMSQKDALNAWQIFK